MKSGLNPQQFLEKLDRDEAAKRDFIMPANQLQIIDDGRIAFADLAYGMNDLYQSQTATYLGYPVKFWQQSREAHPDQWRSLVNAMLSAHDSQRMIRTIDGNARAFLSNRYLRIDNSMVAKTVLETIQDMRDWQVVSADITDTNMYIKVLTPLIKDVSVGQPVQAGFVIRNSEVGLGSYVVEDLMYFLACKNGMIREGSGLRRNHVGTALGGDGNTRELFSDETKRLTDQALMSQTKDIIKAAADEAQFSLKINQLQGTQERQIVSNDVPKVIEVTAKRFDLNETESNAVLRNLIEGSDLSQWGLFNAVTLAAHKENDQHMVTYERSVELERIGGRIAALDGKDWISLTAVK